jgi:single-strand DNA-binding protein
VASNPAYTTVNDTTPKVAMRVAWTARHQDRVTGEWRDGNTSFATVNCWRKLASSTVMSLRKGQPVVVSGRLLIREWEDKEGKRRTAVDIDADTVGHDLNRGVAHFQRVRPQEDVDTQVPPAQLPTGEDGGTGLVVPGQVLRDNELINGLHAEGGQSGDHGQPDEHGQPGEHSQHGEPSQFGVGGQDVQDAPDADGVLDTAAVDEYVESVSVPAAAAVPF